MYYIKDNKIYIEQDLKTDIFWLDYYLIWSVFELEIGHNFQLIEKITKGMLEEVYKCKVNSTRKNF